MSISCRRRFLLTLSAAALLVTAAANAAIYRTTVRAPLRTSPAAQSATLATLPGGTEVEVTSCGKSWCSASWNGRHGWIARHSLTPATSHQQSSGSGYRNSDGDWVPSPHSSPNGPPRGALAQCNDGTYSFSRHHSGTCSHHGGVRQWL